MYIIKNHKNLYIRLNSNGVPVTGTRTEAQLFDKDKANNIVKNLPKSLKKLKFIVLSAPMNDKKDEINKGAETGADDKIEKEEEFITSPPDYKIAPEVSRWVEKVEICEEVANEAKMRINELNSLISASDKEISNILHRIELEPPQNAVNGYYRYKEMRDVLQNRRKIKDEKLILMKISGMNFNNISSDVIKKCIDGLILRKFTLRSTEVNDVDEF